MNTPVINIYKSVYAVSEMYPMYALEYGDSELGMIEAVSGVIGGRVQVLLVRVNSTWTVVHHHTRDGSVNGHGSCGSETNYTAAVGLFRRCVKEALDYENGSFVL